MRRETEVQRWLASAKSNWTALGQFATTIGTVIGGFACYPQFANGEIQKHSWKNLGMFVVVAVCGLVFLMSRKASHAQLKLWMGASVVLLLGGVLIFFKYQEVLARNTCDNYIVGSELTMKGRDYTAKHPTLGCSDLIADFIGVTTDIWTLDSIQSARTRVAVFYLGCVTLFASCLLCLIASIQIAQSSARKHSRVQHGQQKGS